MRAAPLALWVLVVPACAGNPAPTVRPAIVSEQLAATVARAQQVEISLHRAGQVSDMDHQLWQRRFLVIGEGILALNQALRLGDPLQRDTAVRAMLAVLDEMRDVLVPHLDFDQAKLWLTTALDVIRSVLVTVSVTG